MDRLRVVFLDRASLDKGDIDYSCIDTGLLEWHAYDQTGPSEVLERINDADVIVSNKVQIREADLSQAHSVKLICVAATGTNNIDLESARRHDVTVCNARGYATASVVEHVFGLMIALTRNSSDYWQASIDGRWEQSEQFCYLHKPISELSGKTLGIIGYGELGQAVARIARALGMRVMVSQRPGSQVVSEGRHCLDEVLGQSDVITLHCPLAENTRNLINQHAFTLMQEHAILINTSRGGIVNEMDLMVALQTNRIAAAALDVLLEEPPLTSNALLRARLSNLLVTPHVAWASRQARQRLLGEVLDNIMAFSQGRRRNRVV